MEIYHLILFLISLFIIMIYLGECQNEQCPELRCGDKGPAIRFPFRLKDMQPQHCGFPGFEVFCTHAKDTMLELPISVKLSIKTIDYKSQVIQLYYQDDCLPGQLLGLNLSSAHFQYKEVVNNNGKYYALFNCSSTQVLPEYIDPISCLSGPGYKVYAFASTTVDSNSLTIITSCTRIYNDLYIPYDVNLRDHDKILPLEWKEPECRHCEAKGWMCGLKNNSTTSKIKCSSKDTPDVGASKKLVVAGAILGSFVLLLVIFVVYRVYSNEKVEKEYEARIETFLEDYRNFKPARYLYTDIKRITNQFSEKIGEGAYGTVFKGKLSNEIHVAVKILNSFKGNGEDFINEVGTIGRIHHVNVVRLVGFCADGFRRALVYEFLPNDSLDKFISSVNAKNCFLGWEKLQDIALSIAKGIEYLHQGCDQRILHFDIKPHNVLLDQNFNPKISDFGLAKLCSKDQSIVSMTTARGTMGYIAPEVFSRNFGIVSYKADVYSFGMLLLEIVGGSKNFVDIVESTSKNYFPAWIYNLMEQKEDLQVFIEDYEEAQIVKKLAIVGLWCIQWHPLDRPSMKVVIQMLEGVEDKLTMPPNPFPSTSVAKINAQMPPRRLD
ncbi:hypothetical protein I3760_06G062100 [Carya illinoinensis]|nr:hypothetical protein I3760_06G062100 [Carya illinoinensis]KAG2701833.1 hypothetical protein I3760_06G062100 [Carya illinoinensis]KAG2701834.1 hypothetical protein I3760_06G062100 [Carya illinoinensis]